MKKFLIVCTVLLSGYTLYAQNTDKLVAEYDAVKNALVSDDDKKASAAALSFQQAIKAEADFAQKAELQAAADKLAKAATIEKKRAVFNDVSTQLWKAVKASGKIATPVYYQYCPMKKAYWLSKEKDIKNPYYGAAMLTCGSVVETKQ